MFVDCKIGVEHLVGFANWYREPEPISCRREGSSFDAVRFEERIDGIYRSFGGLDELFYLKGEEYIF